MQETDAGMADSYREKKEKVEIELIPANRMRYFPFFSSLKKRTPPSGKYDCYTCIHVHRSGIKGKGAQRKERLAQFHASGENSTVRSDARSDTHRTRERKKAGGGARFQLGPSEDKECRA